MTENGPAAEREKPCTCAVYQGDLPDPACPYHGTPKTPDAQPETWRPARSRLRTTPWVVINAEGELVALCFSRKERDVIIADHNDRATLEAKAARYEKALRATYAALDGSAEGKEGTECRYCSGGWPKSARKYKGILADLAAAGIKFRHRAECPIAIARDALTKQEGAAR